MSFFLNQISHPDLAFIIVYSISILRSLVDLTNTKGYGCFPSRTCVQFAKLNLLSLLNADYLNLQSTRAANHITLHPNGELDILSHFRNNSACCLVCLQRWQCSSKARSEVNLLNDDTYRWVCATINMSSFRQKEHGTH